MSWGTKRRLKLPSPSWCFCASCASRAFWLFQLGPCVQDSIRNRQGRRRTPLGTGWLRRSHRLWATTHLQRPRFADSRAEAHQCTVEGGRDASHAPPSAAKTSVCTALQRARQRVDPRPPSSPQPGGPGVGLASSYSSLFRLDRPGHRARGDGKRGTDAQLAHKDPASGWGWTGARSTCRTAPERGRFAEPPDRDRGVFPGTSQRSTTSDFGMRETVATSVCRSSSAAGRR